MTEPLPPPAASPARFAEEALRLARFFTRLPLPALPFERAPFAPPDLDRAAPALPLVGLLVGAMSALAGLIAYLLGLSIDMAAALALGAGTLATGAFHEDGLADCCDGLFGGSTPERRMEIMRDSRLGTYGVAALVFTFLVRFQALSDLFRLVGPFALLCVIGVAALSRPLALLPALLLPPASHNGLARAVAMPGARSAGLAMVLGLMLALACAAPSELWPGMAAGALAALIAVYGVARLAAAKIGGYTGDLFGMAQQCAEVALLLTLTAAANTHGPL